MTPHLQNLDGTPLSWPELHARFAAWQAREATREDACTNCQDNRHVRCSGTRGHGRWRVCECWCREKAA